MYTKVKSTHWKTWNQVTYKNKNKAKGQTAKVINKIIKYNVTYTNIRYFYAHKY